MKIFIGLIEIAGYYTNLKKGFDEIGVESVFVNLHGHPFQYGDTPNILVKLKYMIINRLKSKSKLRFIASRCWKTITKILSIKLFIWSILKFDVFIFGYKSHFLLFKELAILKFLNKKIIYVFHGSDSRPPYIDGAIMSTENDCSIVDCINLTKIQKKSIKNIERYADVIISNPFSSHLHERHFVSCAFIGVPFIINSYECDNHHLVDTKISNRQKIRVLHAPSHPESKGTYKIRQAIKNLQDKGHLLELIEITGKPNKEVLDELKRCDFVIDQLYSDTLMAGLGSEAALFGIPTIVGGYAQDEINRIYPVDYIPPVYYCHPDKIEDAIEKFVIDNQFRVDLGKQAKQFVRTKWTSKKVAEQYLRLIENDIPEDWLYDPKDISYLHGYGLSEQRVKQLVGEIIENGGEETLQLSDKPALERKFTKFANAC